MQYGFEIWFRKFQERWVASILLAPLSLMYQIGVRLRNYFYDRNWLAIKKAGIPIVSVGNLVAGGVGKTQLVLLLANELLKNMPITILSRGYKGKHEKKKEPLLVNILKHPPLLCGDEPWLLAEKLKGATVVVCKDRVLGVAEAQKKGAKLIIMDDGLQHRKLYRNFDIVLVDGQDPFGKGKFLPWGMLRDDPKRIAKANLIIVVGKIEKKEEEKIKQMARADIVHAKVRSLCIKTMKGDNLGSIKGERVALFCAIGNPNRFIQSISDLGANVVAAKCFYDHADISEKVLEKYSSFSKKRGAKMLLCTEKDKIKLQNKGLKNCLLPIGWVETRLEISENLSAWEKMIEQIKGIVS